MLEKFDESSDNFLIELIKKGENIFLNIRTENFYNCFKIDVVRVT